jgi:hypothetical protein
MILGMQFLHGPGHESSGQTVEKLRQRLLRFNQTVAPALRQ